jgi:hypothetical protein
LAATAETVNDAVLHFQRYAVVCDALSLELNRDSEGVELALYVFDPTWTACRHVGEFAAARIVSALQKITGVQLQLRFVSFMHPDGSSGSECRRSFNCGVKYGTHADIIKLSIENMSIPIPAADYRLGYMLRGYADTLLLALALRCSRNRPALPLSAAQFYERQVRVGSWAATCHVN